MLKKRIRIMTNLKNLQKAISLFKNTNSNNDKLDVLYNEALELLINAPQSVFDAEKLTERNYEKSTQNDAMLSYACQVYEKKTGLKANTRRVFDLALKLYINENE